MSRFDEIKAGLMEAIAYERGELSEGVRVHKPLPFVWASVKRAWKRGREAEAVRTVRHGV